jgi:hypothetical protein
MIIVLYNVPFVLALLGAFSLALLGHKKEPLLQELPDYVALHDHSVCYHLLSHGEIL